jgi:hypothetical protein
VSWPIVSEAFTEHARRVLPAQPTPVSVLGIDEIRRGRPRWVLEESTGMWTTVVDRWHVGFVDLSGDQGLLGQVEGRTIAAVTGWLDQREVAWRRQVAFVAIDMCTIFKSAVHAALPHATLVVDHFHVVQLANTALTEIRRRLTVRIRGRRGRKGNREWELRNRLTRSAARMHARNPHLHPHRHHQRRLRRHQPRHQDHRPRRLRLPQPRKPATTPPLCHNPTRTRLPQPRLTSKSRKTSSTGEPLHCPICRGADGQD